MLSGQERKNIKSGQSVAIVLKQDQDSGLLTDGIVRDVLTKSPKHPHGIKVRLMSGEVGRVKEIYQLKVITQRLHTLRVQYFLKLQF